MELDSINAGPLTRAERTCPEHEARLRNLSASFSKRLYLDNYPATVTGILCLDGPTVQTIAPFPYREKAVSIDYLKHLPREGRIDLY